MTSTNTQPATNEYSEQEISDVIASAVSALAETMTTEDKMAAAKTKTGETKTRAYESVHAVFESYGLNRGDKATVYKQNGHYAELARDICLGLSKKLKDQVDTSPRGEPMFSDRVKKAWSRLVVAYRENRTDTQTERDKANKAIAAQNVKDNRGKAALFDVLVGALRDSAVTQDTLDIIHQRFVSHADTLGA